MQLAQPTSRLTIAQDTGRTTGVKRRMCGRFEGKTANRVERFNIGFYVEEIGSLLLEQPNLIAAFAFYALYIAGLVYLVIAPAAEADSVMKAVISGAVFGLVAYATYDLTNLAVMKGFTLKIALIDMVWGMALSAAVSGLTVKIVSLFQTSNA